ncbi:MAG: hypothetical protein QOE41_1291 [Mycobacterium sp.]|jgi:hypothetical protein|nr:hypothetical protein [Mycobacterium sp.]
MTVGWPTDTPDACNAQGRVERQLRQPVDDGAEGRLGRELT